MSQSVIQHEGLHENKEGSDQPNIHEHEDEHHQQQQQHEQDQHEYHNAHNNSQHETIHQEHQENQEHDHHHQEDHQNQLSSRQEDKQSISVISGGGGGEQEEQEEYLKQNSIQYFEEHDHNHNKNDAYTQRSQINDQDYVNKQDDTTEYTNSAQQNQYASQQFGDGEIHAHVLSQTDRDLVIKSNSNGKVVISGKSSSGQGMMTPKKRLSIQRMSAQKNQNGEESVEKQLYVINDPSDFTKQQNQSNEKSKNESQQNQELIKLRSQNDKLREELKALSDKLSVVIEKNQKNISSQKGRLNNQTSDAVLKQELNNAYKLIDAIQRDNKKLQSQVYEGNHFEKIIKLENDLKSKDQEVKLMKKELELSKKLQKINAAQDEEKKEIYKRNDDYNEKYALKQKIKELQEKMSEQDDKFNKQYREFLRMEKEYRKLCETTNVKPNFVFNEQDNTFEKSSKPSLNRLVSKDRKSGSLVNNSARRSESLKPLDRSKLGNSQTDSQGSNAALLAQGIDPEFMNIAFNEANFNDILSKAKVYKKSKVVNEKKLNNEINELKNILNQKNQEIIALKQQLLNRDRQSNNLQSQLNQLKRQKNNLNEQQSYNNIQITDNNISIDDNDNNNDDVNYTPRADQTNNSIQYATPMKQERQIPKKKLLPNTSNAKNNKSRSPVTKNITITQPDAQTSRKLLSNPSTNLPQSTSNYSPGKQNLKSPKKAMPFALGYSNNKNNEQPRNNAHASQSSTIDANNNARVSLEKNPARSSNEKNPIRNSLQKKANSSVHTSQVQPLPQSSEIINTSRQQQLNKQPSRMSNVNQSAEEFISYSPTRFQNDEKNQPQPNLLSQQSNLNKDDLINSQIGISPQQQVLIPLTLRDVQIGVDTEDSHRFTDRIRLKQNYHHKIVYVQVIHDDKGIVGMQCHYRLQKSYEVVEGDMHIIQNQDTHLVSNEEQYVSDEFNVDEKQQGDYVKYIQGTINTQTNQIVNLIFVTSMGYRKTLGLQNLKTSGHLQSFNLDISENEVPICLYGSLQKIYKDNENPVGSVLTQIGFNVERDDAIEEKIKAFYSEDDQVRTEFEQNQKNQEIKKKINGNNSTKFIREPNPQTQQHTGSSTNIISSELEIPKDNTFNHNQNHGDFHQQGDIPRSQQDSPHFRNTQNKKQEQVSDSLQGINKTHDNSEGKEKKHDHHPQSHIEYLEQDTIHNDKNHHINDKELAHTEFTLSDMKDPQIPNNQDSHELTKEHTSAHSPTNQQSNSVSRNSNQVSRNSNQGAKALKPKVEEEERQHDNRANDSTSRNSISPRRSYQDNAQPLVFMNKLHTDVSNVEKNPSSMTQRSNQQNVDNHKQSDQNKSQSNNFHHEQNNEQKIVNQVVPKNEFIDSQPQTHRENDHHQSGHDNHDHDQNNHNSEKNGSKNSNHQLDDKHHHEQNEDHQSNQNVHPHNHQDENHQKLNQKGDDHNQDKIENKEQQTTIKHVEEAQ